MNNIKLKKSGTVNFWIPPKLFQYNDNLAHILFEFNNIEGSILILKDSDNFLKVFYVLLGYGRYNLEMDVSKVSHEPHMVTFTWDYDKRELNLYFDGENRVLNKMN